MNLPHLEVDLGAVGHNARVLVDRLAARGIAVTGVTKAVLGSPAVARVLADNGVAAIGDSRVENLQRLRGAGSALRRMLVRSPMASQVDQVVAVADVSCNTDQHVLTRLSEAASSRETVHDVVLMVELGDLREGIMPEDLGSFVAAMANLPGLRLVGLGANLACLSGVVPDDTNMGELSSLVESVEEITGRHLDVVSGGNSASLAWALSAPDVGRLTELRLGEAILLGREPSRREPIEGLRLDAFQVVAEVIESGHKPTRSWGKVAQAAFGGTARPGDAGRAVQTIVALGRQDVDPDGLELPKGTTLSGSSSDHLVLATPEVVPVGSTLRFAPNYAALLRAMTSPFVAKVVRC